MPQPSVTPAPATMTTAGLRFLEALAAQATSGCFLEVGPLFGSSTQALDVGRRTSATIHTIDTFEPQDWVVKRLGIELSRSAFDSYTSHIENLVVHQGFAPDVVRESWNEPIGFFFDDATHGDPGWSANFDFFSDFFTRDAIVCGDDFAGGWPDIPRNVTRIAEEWGVGLYVLGRVWAMTRVAESRLVEAAEVAEPALRKSTLSVMRQGDRFDGPAMCWSRGLHQFIPADAMRFDGETTQGTRVTVELADGGTESASVGQWLTLQNARVVHFNGPPGIGIQFCVLQSHKTSNTRLVRSGDKLHIPPGGVIVSARLGMV